MRKLLTAIGAAALVLVVLAGCGSSSSSSSTSASTTTPSTASGGADAAIAAQVPASVKSKGTLTIASDATYAPNEYVAPDGHTVVGMDVDLMNAIGAKMGLKVKFVNATFDTIIPGLAAGKYDLGVSSFTDTKEREKTVDFVDYFTAGISFYAKSSANPGVSTVEDLCGKSVSVEKGTVEQEEAEAQSKKCAKAGKSAVKVLTYPDQNGANLAISSGRAEVGMADSPIAAYQVKQSGGQFKLVGKEYEVAPYGIAIPKQSGLSAPILASLKAIIADGTYASILAKWGEQPGAIKTPTINGATG
ncbi:MAG TPA: ABC transporter substrate-binding protein [Solirubrobacteraceae bacterium]|jgi:polar amino acid transport system substrate-binding protein|nr:ABC transporter substrate-binding protein [Solirubrobacteraceae bacterium]